MNLSFLLLILIFGIVQQPSNAQLRIQGIVVDSENRGIATVSVSVLGTSFGTVTSPDGRFELVVNDSVLDSELCFQRMSYTPRCIPIRTITAELRVALASQPIPMPDVVVTPYARINPTRVVTHAAAEFKKLRHNDLYV